MFKVPEEIIQYYELAVQTHTAVKEFGKDRDYVIDLFIPIIKAFLIKKDLKLTLEQVAALDKKYFGICENVELAQELNNPPVGATFNVQVNPNN
jgi:hypothetical protein